MASFSRTSSVQDMAKVVGMINNEQARPKDQCWQCGKTEHTDKMLSDQCSAGS